MTTSSIIDNAITTRSTDPVGGVSHPVDIGATILCTTSVQQLTTRGCPRRTNRQWSHLWTAVDKPRTTNCHLTCINAMLSTIHSPYYPYYSL